MIVLKKFLSNYPEDSTCSMIRPASRKIGDGRKLFFQGGNEEYLTNYKGVDNILNISCSICNFGGLQVPCFYSPPYYAELSEYSRRKTSRTAPSMNGLDRDLSYPGHVTETEFATGHTQD